VDRSLALKTATGCFGSGVPVHVVPNRSFAAGPRSRIPEHPVLKVKQSYEVPIVECPMTAIAVVQAVGRE
jgi:hypothetical protein